MEQLTDPKKKKEDLFESIRRDQENNLRYKIEKMNLTLDENQTKALIDGISPYRNNSGSLLFKAKKYNDQNLREKIKELPCLSTSRKEYYLYNDDGLSMNECYSLAEKESDEEIDKRKKVVSYINGLALSDAKKEEYKSKVLDYNSDLEEVVKIAKSFARVGQEKRLKEILEPLKLDNKFLSEAVGRLSDDGANCDEVISQTRAAYVQGCQTREEAEAAGWIPDSGSATGSPDSEGSPSATPKKEELKVEVIEGNIIVENNKKIKMERRTVKTNDINEIRSIVVRGKEVFLHEYEKNKEGEIEIKGYGEYGLLPELKGENEKTVAKIFDRALEGRRSEEEESGENDRAGGVIMTMTGAVKVEELKKSEKGRILFEKIGHVSVNEAYALARKEISTIRLLPNVIMSVGSEEERKYVYKNVEIKGKEEEEEDKVWIEGINEIKNYGEDEKSKEKYSDNKVGTVIGYGREIGEGKYIGSI